MWITPKLNWSASDFYNFEDLNRVENNMSVVFDLVSYFVYIPSINVVTNRDMKHIEFVDSLNRIEELQNSLGKRHKPVGWIPNKIDWKENDPFSFSDAIRIEKNMFLLYEYYKGKTDYFPICGTFNCGEEVI